MLRERIAGLHRAIVVDNVDPEGLLRIRVSIPALLGESVSNWAWPSIPNVAGQTAPDVQSPVWVAFEDGDVDRPVWMGTWLPTRFPNAPQTPQNYILSGGINVFPTASAVAFAMQTVGDTISRFEARASGQLRWGGGGAAADVILDRTAPGQLRLSGIRTAGANENTFVLSDPVTGVQAAGFGQRILWRSNNEASLAALAFEVGATGTNNETQIALYTQNVAGSLLRNWLLGSRGDVFHSVSSASAVGYILRAAASQTTDLQQWQNSAGTVLAKLTSVGWLQAERAVVARGVGGGVSFDPVYPIDHGHIYVDAITKLRHHAYYGHVFTTGGGVDIQQWQDPAGNVLAAVPAGGGFNASMAGAGAIRANYDTGFIVGGISLTGYGVLFQSDNGLNNVLNVRGKPTQTANLQEWQNSAGTALAKIGATGELYTPSLYNAGYAAGHTFVNLTSSSTYFFAGGATNVPIVVRGAASQTADLQQWQNSAGDVPALVTSAGRIVAVEGLFVRPGAEDFAVFASTTVASKVPILAKGAASQTANLQEWQDSAGAVRAYVSGTESRLHAAGRVTSPLAYFDSLYSYNGTAPVTVFASSGSVTVFAVRAAAAQNADLQQWQNSTGGVLAKVGATGELYAPYLYNAGYASGHTYVNLTSASTFFFAGAAANIPIVVRGAASQTASLQEWQNSAGTMLARITNTGALSVTGDMNATGYGYFGNGLRAGEVFGDGGLYRATGNMKFSANTITFNHNNGVLRGTFDANGLTVNNNLYVSGESFQTGYIRATGGQGGVWLYDRTNGSAQGGILYQYSNVTRIWSVNGNQDVFHSYSNGDVWCASGNYVGQNGAVIRSNGYSCQELTGHGAQRCASVDNNNSYYIQHEANPHVNASDMSIKRNVRPMEKGDATAKIRSTKPFRFTWAEGKGPTHHGERIGLDANAVPAEIRAKMGPAEGETALMGIDTGAIAALLWGAIAELDERLALVERGRP